MKEIITTGKTVELAIEEACQQMNVSREKVEFEIIDLPKKALFGLKTYPAKVRVFVKEEDKEAIAVEYVTSILKAMGVQDFTAEANKDGDNLNITLKGDDLGFVIGRRGETIDAIQYLASLAINRIDGDYMRITIDSGNFREKREKTLESLAKRLARNVVKTGRSVTLEPMNPYERRIIHTAVQKVRGATSWSEGENLQRHVVIGPDRKKQSYRNRNGRYNSGYGNRNSSQPRRRSGEYQRREYTDEQQRHPDDSVFSTFESEHLEEAPTTSLYGKIEINKD